MLVIIDHKLECIERKLDTIMASQKDLDDAIAALPQKIEDAVDAALAPVIKALEDKASGTPVDFQSEIDQLNAMGATVAEKVTADLTPTVPSPPTNTGGTTPATPADTTGNTAPPDGTAPSSPANTGP